MSGTPQLFKIGDDISAVADVSLWSELPDRECLALKVWHGKRYVFGRFYPGPVPMFASDAASPIEASHGRHKLRKRRPVNFDDVMILPVTGWLQSLA